MLHGDGHFIFACQRALALYQSIKKAMNETVAQPTIFHAHSMMSLVQPTISQAHSMMSLVQPTISHAHSMMSLVQPTISQAHSMMSLVQPTISHAHSMMSLVQPTISQAHSMMSLVQPTISHTHSKTSLVQPTISQAHSMMSLVQPTISHAHSMMSPVHSTRSPVQPSLPTPNPECVYESIDDLTESRSKNVSAPQFHLNDAHAMRSSGSLNLDGAQTHVPLSLTKPNSSCAQTTNLLDNEDTSPTYTQVVRSQDRARKPNV